ncbi:radical SAM protein, partial [Pseudodesulfovibrio sp. S3-i]
MSKERTGQSPRKVKCLAPWTHFYIMEKGYGPCCDVTFPIGNRELEERLDNSDDFLDLFNSNSLINLRQAFVDDNIPYSCKVCIECGYNKEYEENADSGLDLSLLAPHSPRSVSLVVESPCNINCVFCKSIRTSRDPEGDFRTFSKLFARLEEIGWNQLDFIRVGGGEPFFNPGFNLFIRSYDWSRMGDTCLKITTNATLLHKVLDELSAIPKVDFTFSVDAIGSAYESLRRGASWEKVRENLRKFSAMMKERPGWSATIHSIVMKTSLPHIGDLMTLAHDLGFGYSLMNMH